MKISIRSFTILVVFGVGLLIKPDMSHAVPACMDLFKKIDGELRPIATPQKLVTNYSIIEPVAPKVVRVERGLHTHEIGVIEYDSRPTDRLDIEKVMKDFKLNRLKAVELQAVLRRYTKSPSDQEFIAAVEAVRNGYSLSKLNIEKIKKSQFTLVLDIDGTLIDQDTKKFIPDIHEASFLVDGNKIHHVAVNPAAISLIQKAKARGGTVVLFSRNNDLLIWEILMALKVGDQPLISVLDGVLTSSHMVLPRHLRKRVDRAELSTLLRKDLSIIPNKRILLIDDDPGYVLQTELTIAVKKFEVDKIFSYKSESFLTNARSEFDPERGLYNKTEGLSKKELHRLEALLKYAEDEYKLIGNQLDFLLADPAQFTNRQIIFSPLGTQAMELLTGNHSRYFLPNHSAMKSDAAFAYLVEDPKRIFTILKSKELKKVSESEYSWSF